MITAEQVREITFSSKFNGYKAEEVDSFLDSCADTIQALTETNEELKKKMKILADKLVEYRQEENNIHSALMNAQRMSDSVVREANQKADLILDDAKAKAAKIMEKAERDIQSKKTELSQVENEVALFKSRLLSLYKEHLSLINAMPEPEEEPAEETPEQPADTVPESQPAEPAAEPPAAETPAEIAQPEAEPPAEPSVPLMPTEESPEETEEEPNQSRFSDLQFGDDYAVSEEARGFFRRKK